MADWGGGGAGGLPRRARPQGFFEAPARGRLGCRATGAGAGSSSKVPVAATLCGDDARGSSTTFFSETHLGE